MPGVVAAEEDLSALNVATADQTGAEIKAAYEAEADTNAFTDAEKAKVANVPADTNAALAAKADTASLGTAADNDEGNFATAAQGALADSAVQPTGTSLVSPDAGNTLTQNATFWTGSQAAYDAIATPDANTFYFVPKP